MVKKFGSGGYAKTKLQTVNRPKTDHGSSALFKEGGDTMARDLKKLFAGKETKKEEAAEKKAFPSKAAYKKAEAKYEGEKMARGGVSKMSAGAASHAQKEGRKVAKEMEYDYKTGKKSFAGSVAKRDAHAEKEGKRVAKAMEFDYSKGRTPKMAKGGVASSGMGKVVAGGNKGKGEHTIQKSGLSKGKMVVMKKGGKAC